MGQQKNTKLKAFVRYDGTGRVIAGSLILQRSKPKVGNWSEINATECCGYVPTTTTTTTAAPVTTTTTTTAAATTTTTTSAPTTTTTTTVAVFTFSDISGGSSQTIACNGSGYIFTAYSNVSSFTTGTVLYTDSSLTTPVNTSTFPGYIGDPYFIVQSVGSGAPRFMLDSSGVIDSPAGTCPV